MLNFSLPVIVAYALGFQSSTSKVNRLSEALSKLDHNLVIKIKSTHTPTKAEMNDSVAYEAFHIQMQDQQTGLDFSFDGTFAPKGVAAKDALRRFSNSGELLPGLDDKRRGLADYLHEEEPTTDKPTRRLHGFVGTRDTLFFAFTSLHSRREVTHGMQRVSAYKRDEVGRARAVLQEVLKVLIDQKIIK